MSKFKEFDSVIGYDEIKYELEVICDMMNNVEKYEALGARVTPGVLLLGVPGVGKTTLAKCLLNASHWNQYVCRKGKSNGDFVKEINDTFEKAAQNEPAIILLDDLDKFANEDYTHPNAPEFVAVQTGIDNVKGKKVFVIATANDDDTFPDSLLRPGRLEKILVVPIPDGKESLAIIEHYLSKLKNVGNIDAKEIARIMKGRSCAQLESVINEAAVIAGFKNKASIEMDDIVSAVLKVLFNAPEVHGDLETNYLKTIAYHEAGHAVVAEILEPGSISLISINKHRGEIGGLTAHDQSEDYFKDISFMENRVMGLLAGRAAVEIATKTKDVGAFSDIDRADKIVRRFVTQYCCYGFEYFPGSLRGISPGSDKFNMIDERVAKSMTWYNRQARIIIQDNIEFLESLAKELIERKTLLSSDIQRIKESVKTKGYIKPDVI